MKKKGREGGNKRREQWIYGINKGMKEGRKRSRGKWKRDKEGNERKKKRRRKGVNDKQGNTKRKK